MHFSFRIGNSVAAGYGSAGFSATASFGTEAGARGDAAQSVVQIVKGIVLQKIGNLDDSRIRSGRYRPLGENALTHDDVGIGRNGVH